MAFSKKPGKDPNDKFDPPKTPRVVLATDPSQTLNPDTEENVIEETDGIFRNFVYQMQTIEHSNGEPDDTPSFSELTAFPDSNPFSPAVQVGRRLAAIGDDINVRYTPQFNSMIQMLHLSPDTAYDAFAEVAKRLFKDGCINWGRIVTLLCFGYQLSVTVIQRGIRGFFSKIIGFVIQFLINQRITRWIAQQGGWRAALCLVPETMGWTNFGLIIGLAAVSVLAVFYLARQK